MSYHIYLTVSMTLKIHYHNIIKYDPFTSSVVMDEWEHRFPRYRLGSDMNNRNRTRAVISRLVFKKTNKQKNLEEDTL